MIPSGWTTACAAFVSERGLPPRLLKAVAAFGALAPGSELPAPAFADVERAAEALAGGLPSRVQAAASREVDEAQAAMFGRRCGAVLTLLEQVARRLEAGRLLRTAFVARLDELLAAEAAAIRLRALIDFCYSQAAVLHHTEADGTGKLPAPWELVQRSRWKRLARGLFSLAIEGMTRRGPTRMSLLRFDRFRFTFRCLDARDASGEGAVLEELAGTCGAVAALSGGFFLYSEPDIEPPARRHDPVGLLVTDGRVVVPPLYRRPAFVQDAEGRVHFRPFGMKDVVIELPGGLELRPGAVNSKPVAARAPVVFHRAHGAVVEGLPGPVLRFSAGRYLESLSGGGRIPSGGFVLSLPAGRDWEGLAGSLAAGTAVGFRFAARPGAEVAQAMAGGPTLLSGGRIVLPLAEEDFTGLAEPLTFTQDETGDQNLLPRLALGLTADHEVIVAAVDGRNFDRAVGLTLSDLSSVLRAAGCTDAINMDGGSSKRLVAAGCVLDLPSTDILGPGDAAGEVRAVHSAILALPR